MKYLFFFLFFSSFATYSSLAQGIRLKKGQKLKTVNHSTISLTQDLMGQSVEMSSTIDETREFTVDQAVNDGFAVTSRITHIKSSSSVMGQDMDFDSDDTASANSEYGEALKKQMEQVIRFTVDGNGDVRLIKDTADDEDEGAGGMMKALGTDPAQDYKTMFLANGARIRKGDTWKDSTDADGIKTVTQYTVLGISGDLAEIESVALSDIAKDVESQGIQVKLTMTLKSTSHASYDLKTGILTRSETKSEGEGKADAMNMTIPMTMKINRSSDVQH